MGLKLPYFPLFVHDFQTDEAVMRMTYAQEGIYLALLRHQWINGSIPADPEEAAKVLKPHDMDDLEEVMRLFAPIAGTDRASNTKLAGIRADLDAQHERRVAAGHKRLKQSSSIAPAMLGIPDQTRPDQTTASPPAAEAASPTDYPVLCVVAANKALERLTGGSYKPLRHELEEATARAWEADGIPVELAARAIRDTTERFKAGPGSRQPRSLRYYDPSVREAYEKSRTGDARFRAPDAPKPITAAPPPPEPTPEEVMADLEAKAAAQAARKAGNVSEVLGRILPRKAVA